MMLARPLPTSSRREGVTSLEIAGAYTSAEAVNIAAIDKLDEKLASIQAQEKWRFQRKMARFLES